MWSAADRAVLALLEHVKTLEARSQPRDNSLVATFSVLSQTIQNLQDELTATREELDALKRQRTSFAPSTATPPDIDIEQLFKKVFTMMRREASLARKSDIPVVPDGLSTTLDSLSNELYHSARVVPRLMLRVNVLEASHSSSSIKMGGHVFLHEAAVEGWLKALNDRFTN